MKVKLSTKKTEVIQPCGTRTKITECKFLYHNPEPIIISLAGLVIAAIQAWLG